MPDAALEGTDSRTRVVTALGVIALWMAAWGFYFSHGTWLALGEHGPVRPSFAPWVLAYCLLSASLTLGGGLGLLRRRRWGPPVAAFAGESWMITSTGFLMYYATMISKLSTPARGIFWDEVRRSFYVYSGGAIVALIAGGWLASPLFRPAILGECGDARQPSGSLPRIALVLWGLCGAGVTTILLRWYVERWDL